MGQWTLTVLPFTYLKMFLYLTCVDDAAERCQISSHKLTIILNAESYLLSEIVIST